MGSLRQWLQTSWLDKFRSPNRRSHLEAMKLRSDLVRLYTKGRLAEAVGTARELVDWQRRTRGPDSVDLAIGLANLGRLLHRAGDATGAAAVMAEAAALQRRRAQRAAHDLAVFELLLELKVRPPEDANLYRSCIDTARAWHRRVDARPDATNPFARLLDWLERPGSLSESDREIECAEICGGFPPRPSGEAVTSPQTPGR
ncbi:MAG: tetratricopeptide repeat protein [Isosphaeraceae bacterium]